MTSSPKLKKKYQLARCCTPLPPERITGYFSHDDFVKVHRFDCANLAKAESARLLSLEWAEVVDAEPPLPGEDFSRLDGLDFAVLRHHRDYDIDYSLMLAKVLGIPKEQAFERHQKLRNLVLLQRVDAVMVRYRENTAPNKWIKHRNHTYFQLTQKGRQYLDRYLASQPPDGDEASQPGGRSS